MIRPKKLNNRKSGIQEARREKRRREADARQNRFDQLSPTKKAERNPSQAAKYL